MKRQSVRSGERGTIAIMAAALLFVLFSFTALAVDIGYLYTRSRIMYAVADSAVAVGMKDFVASASSSTITADVNDVAGKYGGAYTITPSVSGNQLTVTVTHTYSLFFAKILGLPSKTLTVVAIAQKSNPTPALLALGNVCGSGVGLTINGQGGMTVNGDVEGNGQVKFATGTPSGTCPPPVSGGAHISGSALSNCAGGPVTNAGTPGQNCWDTTTGSYGFGGPFTDPFAPFTPPPCDFGSLSSGGDPTTGHWTLTGILWKLDPGVYCTNGNLNINGFFGQGVDATGVTFIDNGGTIGFGLNASSTFSAAASSPNSVIAYTNNATPCSGGQAIQFGGPSPGTVTINGSFYAPLGCINAGSNGTVTVTGSFIGNEIQLGDFGAWTMGPGGGGGGSSWQMLQ